MSKLQSNVKEKLIYDANKKRTAEYKAVRDAKIKEIEDKASFKRVDTIYKKSREAEIKKIRDAKVDNWKQWNNTSKTMKCSGEPADAIDAKKKESDAACDKTCSNILNTFEPTIKTYVEDVKKYNKPLGKTLTVEQERTYILNQGEKQFQESVNLQMKAARELAKLKALGQNIQFDTDAIRRKLSDVPLKIDETIDSVQEILNFLLGLGIVPPFMNPASPEFDVGVIIAKIKALLDPVIAATSPLSAAVGKIPLIGDLMQILTTLSGGSSSTKMLSREEVEKILGKIKPEPPTWIIEKGKQVFQDVMTLLSTLPMILINLIFSMLDVIYSKLSIITSVIPLGNLFPLSLIPSAIEAYPQIVKLVKGLPKYMNALITGIIKDAFAQVGALMISPLSLDFDAINTLADDIVETDSKPKVQADKKLSYSDVTEECYHTLSSYGYTSSQLKNIQKSYKKIFDGSNTEMVKFVDNNKEQKIPIFSGGEQVIGFDEKKVMRTEPSVEDYQKYLDGLLKESKDLREGVYYDKIKTLESTIGEWYPMYKDQLTAYGDEVLFHEKLQPSEVLKNMVKADAERL